MGRNKKQLFPITKILFGNFAVSAPGNFAARQLILPLPSSITHYPSPLFTLRHHLPSHHRDRLAVEMDTIADEIHLYHAPAT